MMSLWLPNSHDMSWHPSFCPHLLVVHEKEMKRVSFSAFVGDLLQEQFSLQLGSVFFVGINQMRCFEMALIQPVGT